jgi:hypothetical protein
MYSFIPDAGFVGTAFVHALANTLTQALSHIQLVVQVSPDAADKGVRVVEYTK